MLIEHLLTSGRIILSKLYIFSDNNSCFVPRVIPVSSHPSGGTVLVTSQN